MTEREPVQPSPSEILRFIGYVLEDTPSPEDIASIARLIIRVSQTHEMGVSATTRFPLGQSLDRLGVVGLLLREATPEDLPFLERINKRVLGEMDTVLDKIEVSH